MLYAIYLAAPISDVFESYSDLQCGVGALRRVHEILCETVEGVDGHFEYAGLQSSVRDNVTRVGSSNGRLDGLRFESVGFGYDSMDRRVLDDVSFHVDVGTHAGLVGASGSGKSTIFSLACRLYTTPQRGTIRISGVDLNVISLRESRSLIGLLDQNAAILFGSLRENLVYGNPNASDQDVAEIIERVNLDALVRKLPRGLDSQLGEHGILVSGGERQ